VFVLCFVGAASSVFGVVFVLCCVVLVLLAVHLALCLCLCLCCVSYLTA